jgi:hypothetical protein
MINAIESVLRGDPTYPAAFKRANRFWREFFAQRAGEADDALQRAIESAQKRFQQAMAESGLAARQADEIMAMSCLGALYDDGFANPELARRVVNTIRTSNVLSPCIRRSINEARQIFDL